MVTAPSIGDQHAGAAVDATRLIYVGKFATLGSSGTMNAFNRTNRDAIAHRFAGMRDEVVPAHVPGSQIAERMVDPSSSITK
jgi:hypothetical protein